MIASIFNNADLDYRAIFLVATVFLVVAAICVLFVHERR
jgi:hypothetical protein